MSLITSFNTDESFWVMNPQFKNVNPFKKLHDSDRSRNKANSSKRMWFVSQALDDHADNLFKNAPYEQRVNLLSADYMGDPDYFVDNEQELQQYFDVYISLHNTIARKTLVEFHDKLVDRAKFMKDTKYTVDRFDQDMTTGKVVKIAGTAKMLDDMMKNTKPIYELYHSILKSLSEEDESNQVKGGQTLSLSDTGDI